MGERTSAIQVAAQPAPDIENPGNRTWVCCAVLFFSDFSYVIIPYARVYACVSVVFVGDR